jgi:hypothetical protein
MHALGHRRSDRESKVDAIDARHVAAREHRLLNVAPLALIQGHRGVASSTGLACLLLRVGAGLGLALLLVGLTLLRAGRAGCRLPLLRVQIPLLRLLSIAALISLLRLLSIAALIALLRLLGITALIPRLDLPPLLLQILILFRLGGCLPSLAIRHALTILLCP